MGSCSPRPVPPADLTVPAVGLFFLCSQAQGTEKSAGPSPSRALDARRMSRRGSPGDVLCPPPNSSEPRGPPPWRGARVKPPPAGPSLTGSAAGAPTLAAAIHTGKRRGEEGEGEGEGAGEGEGEGGPGRLLGRGGCGERHRAGIPSVPAPLPLLAPFSTLDPPKFFWYEIGPSLLSTSQLAVPGKSEVSKRKRPRFTRRS